MKENKRPITPYWLFVEDEKSKGNTSKLGELAGIWDIMPDSEKQPYFDKFKKVKSKSGKIINPEKSLISSYNTKQIAELCKNNEKYDDKLYKGLAILAQKFVENIGKEVGEIMQKAQEKMVKVDNVRLALEKNKKYEFITKKNEYQNLIHEFEYEEVKQDKKRKPSKGQKNPLENFDKTKINNPRKLSSSGKNPETNDVFFLT